MRFETLSRSLRLLAISLFPLLVLSCGVVEEGEGEQQIIDPRFAACRGDCPLDNDEPEESAGPPALPPSLNLPVFVDFEAAGAPYTFGDFGGGAVTVIDNPRSGGRNTSVRVARMIKNGGELYGGTTFTLPSALDFSAGEIMTIKVWSPRETELTFKLEGATDAGDREVLVTHQGFSRWEELVLDFSGMNPPTGTGITLIFDNGTNGAGGSDWTFYMDDISGGVAGGGGGGGELLTNGTFETGTTAGWGFDANDGTFAATMEQAASGDWSGKLVASVPGGGGPASFPVAKQSNLAIGTVIPGQAITVSFDYCGSVEGVSGEVQKVLLSERAGGAGASATDLLGGNLTPTDTWQQFTFTTVTGADVAGGVSLELKAVCGAVAGCGVNFYFDNVSIVLDSDVGNPSNAGGACPAAPPPPAPDGLPVDFEDAGGPYTFGDFGGGETMIIDNPDMTGNSSAKVAQMKKFTGELYGATTLTLEGPIDFTSSEIITMKVWSQRVANVEFKVEGQPGNVTVIQPTSGVPGGVWETLTFDFTGLISDPVSAVSIFFDNGIVGDAAGDPVAWTFYVDDIELFAPPAPVTALPVDFEDAGGPYTFGDFGGGETMIIDNPDMTGNSSAKVAQMKKFTGELYGATTLTLDGPIDFTSSEIITMKVWSQRVANVEFKVEGQPGNVTVIQPTSGVPGGVWETLTFDFTGLISDPVSAVSIFFDNGIVGDAAGDPVAWTFYVDDIELGGAPPPPMGGELAINGDFEAGNLTGWSDFPNSGTVTADDTENNGGTWSGKLFADAAFASPLFKQANIGIGTVTPNTTMVISFDMKGTMGPGGVVFAEFFSELSGSGTSSAVIFTGGPLPVTSSWDNYCYTTDTGGDVSGGVTLQLKVACGGAACDSTAYFDNVSVTVGNSCAP